MCDAVRQLPARAAEAARPLAAVPTCRSGAGVRFAFLLQAPA